MSELNLIEWFVGRPLPAILPEPAVVIGGTCLLTEFLRRVGDATEGSLLIAAPYYEKVGPVGNEAWESLRHREIDLLLVTRGGADAMRAENAMAPYPWRSLTIASHPRLHGKVYALRTKAGGMALIGSHNLTTGGLISNEEIGVMFLGTGLFVTKAIDAAYRWAEKITEGGKVLDSGPWNSRLAG